MRASSRALQWQAAALTASNSGMVAAAMATPDGGTTRSSALALAILAAAALLLALPGLFDRALPLACELPARPLHCDKPCAFKCTSAASWRDYPYLVLDAEGEGAAVLRWNGALELSPGAAADAGARWDGQIGEAQLIIAGTLRVAGLTLHSRLRPLARLQLLAAELLAPEPYSASSNNTTAPRWVLQGSLIAWTGALSALALLLCRKRQDVRLAILIAGFAVVTGGPLASLAAHAAHATRHSALQGSLRDEEAARFGQPFAELADALRAAVPEGALVLFPRDLEHADESEAHWMDFHFWPAYRSVPYDGAAPDYIFWYRPLTLQLVKDSIQDQSGKVLYRVETLKAFDRGRALFRVRH